MRSRGTRVDNLKYEGKPGLYRIIRFGHFSLDPHSKEMIDFNKKELENLRSQIDVILKGDE